MFLVISGQYRRLWQSEENGLPAHYSSGQWIVRHGTSGEAFVSLGEEPVPPWFLHDLEERGLTAPPSLLNDERDGLAFRTIINASESGLYVDDTPARFFKPIADVDSESGACLFTSRAEAAKFWPWLDNRRQANDQTQAAQGRRSPRGAKTAWNWDDALIEAAVFIIEFGLPEKQAELIAHVAQWFGDNGPGDTQIKEHLAPLYRKAKQALSR